MSKKLSQVLYSGASLLMLAPVFGAAVQPITASAKRRPVHYSRRVRRPRYRARRTRHGRKAARRYAMKHLRKRNKIRRAAKKSHKRSQRKNATLLFKRIHKNMMNQRKNNHKASVAQAAGVRKGHHIKKHQRKVANLMLGAQRKGRTKHSRKAALQLLRTGYRNANMNQRNAQINRAFQANGTLGQNNARLHRAVFHYYHSHKVSFTTAINHVLTQRNISFLNKQAALFNHQLNLVNNDLRAGNYNKASKDGKAMGISHNAIRKTHRALTRKHANKGKALRSFTKHAKARHKAARKRVLRRKTVSLRKAKRHLSNRDFRRLGELAAKGVFAHRSSRSANKLLNMYLNDPQLMFTKSTKAHKHARKLYAVKATNKSTGHQYTMVGTNRHQLQQAYNDDKTAGVASNGQAVNLSNNQQSAPAVTDSTERPDLFPVAYFWNTTPQEAAEESSVGYNRKMANHEVDMINNDSNLSQEQKEVLLSDAQMLGKQLSKLGIQINAVNPSVLQSLGGPQPND